MDSIFTEEQNKDRMRSFAGLSWEDSFASLRKWCHHYRPSLNWACGNAFGIKDTPHRTENAVFFVNLELTPEAEKGKERAPLKMFHVLEAKLMDTEDVFTIPLWGKAIKEHFELTAKVDKKDRLMEGIMFMMVVCRLHMKLTRVFFDPHDTAQFEETGNEDWLSILKKSTRQEQYCKLDLYFIPIS